MKKTMCVTFDAPAAVSRAGRARCMGKTGAAPYGTDKRGRDAVGTRTATRRAVGLARAPRPDNAHGGCESSQRRQAQCPYIWHIPSAFFPLNNASFGPQRIFVL